MSKNATKIYIFTANQHVDRKGREYVKGDAIELTAEQAEALVNKVKLADEVDSPTENIGNENGDDDSTENTSVENSTELPEGIEQKGDRFYVGKKYFTKVEKAIAYLNEQE